VGNGNGSLGSENSPSYFHETSSSTKKMTGSAYITLSKGAPPHGVPHFVT